MAHPTSHTTSAPAAPAADKQYVQSAQKTWKVFTKLTLYATVFAAAVLILMALTLVD